MNSSTEQLDVLDERGQNTGVVKNRIEVHTEGLWHRTVHLWIVNTYGDIFLQKRSADFYLKPNLMEATVIGHISAGMTAEETVVREAMEEVGLTIPVDQLEFLMTDKTSFKGSTKKIPEYINNEFHDVYIWKSDVNLFDFKFDTQEMNGLELVTQNDFGRMIYERDDRLVPQWKEYETLLWYLGGK